ncbi:MAG: DUF1854 domain-containing protein [Clostridia bacterium]|nr:DUF1854 domain-containing protein [Clostridia bacterium]
MQEKDILQEEIKEVEKLLTVNKLTKENATFSETKGGFITLLLDGEQKGQVNVICTFPFTAPNEFLSVRTADDKEEELGIIENLNDFDEQTVLIIKKQLEIRYFMPEILKVFSVKEEYGHTYWSVLTNKGKHKFTSPSGSSGSVIRNGNRVIIKDSDQNRYEIKDLSKLTPKEMKKLDLYL